MLKFLDGPAGGITLDCRRAPPLLRVVCDQGGQWDALDAVDDTPKTGETIYVYRREGDVSSVTAGSRGPGGGCRPFSCADYRFFAHPADAEVRDTARWQQWAIDAHNAESAQNALDAQERALPVCG